MSNARDEAATIEGNLPAAQQTDSAAEGSQYPPRAGNNIRIGDFVLVQSPGTFQPGPSDVVINPFEGYDREEFAALNRALTEAMFGTHETPQTASGDPPAVLQPDNRAQDPGHPRYAGLPESMDAQQSRWPDLMNSGLSAGEMAELAAVVMPDAPERGDTPRTANSTGRGPVLAIGMPGATQPGPDDVVVNPFESDDPALNAAMNDTLTQALRDGGRAVREASIDPAEKMDGGRLAEGAEAFKKVYAGASRGRDAATSSQGDTRPEQNADAHDSAAHETLDAAGVSPAEGSNSTTSGQRGSEARIGRDIKLVLPKLSLDSGKRVAERFAQLADQLGTPIILVKIGAPPVEPASSEKAPDGRTSNDRGR